MALAVHKNASLGELADMADNMAEVQGPQAQVYQLNHQGEYILELQLLRLSYRRSGKHCSHLHQCVNNHSLTPNLMFAGITSDLARKL